MDFLYCFANQSSVKSFDDSSQSEHGTVLFIALTYPRNFPTAFKTAIINAIVLKIKACHEISIVFHHLPAPAGFLLFFPPAPAGFFFLQVTFPVLLRLASARTGRFFTSGARIHCYHSHAMFGLPHVICVSPAKKISSTDFP